MLLGSDGVARHSILLLLLFNLKLFLFYFIGLRKIFSSSTETGQRFELCDPFSGL